MAAYHPQLSLHLRLYEGDKFKTLVSKKSGYNFL
jgi:hypothetical protein